MAMAVLPVPGCPAIKMALPAIFPSLMRLSIIPAALLAFFYGDQKRWGEKAYLSDEALGDIPWVQSVVQTQSSDVGMGGDSLPALNVFYLGDFGGFNIHFVIYKFKFIEAWGNFFITSPD